MGGINGNGFDRTSFFTNQVVSLKGQEGGQAKINAVAKAVDVASKDGVITKDEFVSIAKAAGGDGKLPDDVEKLFNTNGNAVNTAKALPALRRALDGMIKNSLSPVAVNFPQGEQVAQTPTVKPATVSDPEPVKSDKPVENDSPKPVEKPTLLASVPKGENQLAQNELNKLSGQGLIKPVVDSRAGSFNYALTNKGKESLSSDNPNLALVNLFQVKPSSAPVPAGVKEQEQKPSSAPVPAGIKEQEQKPTSAPVPTGVKEQEQKPISAPVPAGIKEQVTSKSPEIQRSVENLKHNAKVDHNIFRSNIRELNNKAKSNDSCLATLSGFVKLDGNNNNVQSTLFHVLESRGLIKSTGRTEDGKTTFESTDKGKSTENLAEREALSIFIQQVPSVDQVSQKKEPSFFEKLFGGN